MNNISATLRKARGMSRDEFEAILNRGPLATGDALASKIVDKLGYWDQVQDFFKRRAGGWNPVSLNSYRTSLNAPNFALEKIAIVYASGLIVSGEFRHHARAADSSWAAIR